MVPGLGSCMSSEMGVGGGMAPGMGMSSGMSGGPYVTFWPLCRSSFSCVASFSSASVSSLDLVSPKFSIPNVDSICASHYDGPQAVSFQNSLTSKKNPIFRVHRFQVAPLSNVQPYSSVLHLCVVIFKAPPLS